MGGLRRLPGPVGAERPRRGGGLLPSGWTAYSGVFNASDKTAGTTLPGNGFAAVVASGGNSVRSTVPLPLKTWCSFVLAGTGDGFIGVANASEALTNYPGQTANSFGYDGEDGNVYSVSGTEFDGTLCAQWDVITIARNGPNLWFARNGAWLQGDPILGTLPFVHGISGDLYFMGPRNADTVVMGSLPSGFAP